MNTRRAASIEENPVTPDPTLLWYSRAVGIMLKKRKFVDPTSWRFQAAVHDYDSTTDPYLNPDDPPPDASVLAKYGLQCQHSSWFFVSWHRMYLYLFEQMVAAAVVEAGGPAGWTLPYWDYGSSDAARKLPWSFRQPTWPGGETNYLYVPQRAPGLNDGTVSLSPNDVESAKALAMRLFATSPTSSDVEFGGPEVKNHEGGEYPFGGLESSPHNNVHVAVGGPDGFMIDPTTAALDPIFWLHHCNIDRLWEVWIRQPERENPTDATWLREIVFPFFDASKKGITMTSSQVVDTTKLGYAYDGMSSLPAPVEAPQIGRPLRRRVSLVGSTSEPVSLFTEAVHVKVPTLARAPLELAGPGQERVLLHLEHLVSKGRAGSYDVYLDVPTGQPGAGGSALYAGRVSLFGSRGATRRSLGHGRDSFNFVLDVSDIYRSLSASQGWDPTHLKVVLKPVYAWSDEVTVGRVSVNAA